MEQEQLRERIQKTTEKIAKIEKKVKKWEDAQTREAFLKADKWLLDLGRDESYLWGEYIKDCQMELRRARIELDEAKVLLDKYNNLLALEEAKDDEFDNRRIKIIWDFLLNYKDMVSEYIRSNMDTLNEYYKVSSDSCNWHNGRYAIMEKSGISYDEWKEKLRELEKRARFLKEMVHPYTWLCVKREPNGDRVVDEAKLDEILLKDCKKRYIKLIDEVTAYTGNITDATGLNMNCGELGGIIVGDKGKAKVQTFSAGGHSEHIIVNERHGQCYHYRHKVTKVD